VTGGALLRGVSLLLVLLGGGGLAAPRAEVTEAQLLAEVRQSRAPGPAQPTLESLAQFEAPEWFRDAKLGIWSHWGPQ
jgi:alpha-L-fucosidase